MNDKADSKDSQKQMKTWLLWSGTCLLLGFFIVAALLIWFAIQWGSLWLALGYLRGEKLLLRTQTVNLGGHYEGELCYAQFEAVNMGSKPVKIVGGVSTCRCVATGNLPTIVQPGKSVLLDVQIRMPKGVDWVSYPVIFYTDLEGQQRLMGRIFGHVVKK